MFAKPEDPPLERLYSKKFIRRVRGLLRCLQKLLLHPRSKMPENYFFLYHLITYYKAIVNAPDVESSEENIKLLKEGMDVCRKYEDIVARVIAGGKTVVEALEEIKEERRSSEK